MPLPLISNLVKLCKGPGRAGQGRAGQEVAAAADSQAGEPPAP
jgi:hypothetical protein